MPKGFHHVTREQRPQIYVLKAIPTPQHKIAEMIGVSPSSVCRELKRHTGQRGYRFKQAEALSPWFDTPRKNLLLKKNYSKFIH